ncbi:DUF4363 family protein [Oceanobacillus alkalisoli]|uniref:DUF4363 family protein n=1 Tax=Oceanobacillus alkalisoli TaxID=2925113 RepID=UPI001EF099B2|nr:DUF4363 family protein [Oceanobacillus alkalisoli]MCF3944702.1 DUF4363 family protein [Oceanobacillus alkalisoli]MCG5105082.1 DUF4363 family protein [Oceanobacillus alkalisoli]
MGKIVGLICLFILLVGCEVNIGGQNFYDQINEIEQQMEAQDWEEVVIKSEELKRLFKKDKWKLQFLGDEDEYESLYEAINKLIAAGKGEDEANIRMELSIIHTYIEDIYSL